MHISDWSSDVCSSDLESLAAEPLRSLHGSWRGPSSLVRQMFPASRGIDRRHTVVTVAARVASPFLSQSKIGIVGRYFGEYQGPIFEEVAMQDRKSTRLNHSH